MPFQASSRLVTQTAPSFGREVPGNHVILAAAGVSWFFLSFAKTAPEPTSVRVTSALPAQPAPRLKQRHQADEPMTADVEAKARDMSSEPIRIMVPDRELYDEMTAVARHIREKPLRETGPKHSVGDGLDASERDAKLPADTPFSRFRYEYEKHTTDRLLADLAWAEQELRALGSGPEAEQQTRKMLLQRRHRAIASILDARTRAEEIHDRYQRLQVVYTGPGAGPAPAASL